MRIILFVLIFVVANISSGQENSTSKAEKIFIDIQQKVLSRLPESFYGRLKAKTIEKNLKNIPKNSYIDKNKEVYVEVYYSKKDGVNFRVKNVDELYRDMYKNLPRQIFAFDLLLAKTEENTLKKYDIKLEYESETTTVLKLNIKNSENTIAIYIDKKTDRILRVDYELGSNLINSTIIIYNNFKNYSLPYKFISKSFKDGTSLTPEIYEIDNIQIK